MAQQRPIPRTPTFNHVAMSLPAEALDEQGRSDILRFYGEVFGWTEMPTLTEDRQRLVLRAYSNEQFVFLVAEERPMQCATMDHFGMSVATPEELDGILARARKFQEQDGRVELVDRDTQDYKALKLHNFYVRYLLPMRIEVQCYEWEEGLGPDSMPKS
ncbi:MAG: hypothetical protein V3U03_13100 [Myxococcota bacterium]